SKHDSNFVASFSNYGKHTVDLFSPGVDIYSTVPDDKYERNQGTSMASPVVSGTAALIMAYYPDLTTAQVRKIILENVTPFGKQQVVVPHKQNEETQDQPLDRKSVV